MQSRAKFLQSKQILPVRKKFSPVRLRTELFSKGGAVEGAEPSSPHAGGEQSIYGAFLFAKLFLLRLLGQKKKRN